MKVFFPKVTLLPPSFHLKYFWNVRPAYKSLHSTQKVPYQPPHDFGHEFYNVDRR